MAALASLLEDRQNVGPSVGAADLHQVLFAAHGEVEARLDVGDLVGMTGAAGGVRLAGGSRQQALVSVVLACGLRIAFVAAFTAFHAMN
jgi:hypothetical protein